MAKLVGSVADREGRGRTNIDRGYAPVLEATRIEHGLVRVSRELRETPAPRNGQVRPVRRD